MYDNSKQTYKELSEVNQRELKFQDFILIKISSFRVNWVKEFRKGFKARFKDLFEVD